MNILCINTCLKESDVSVIKDDGIYSAKRYTNLQHSITLMSQIEEALEKAEITKNELDYIAVCVGTGSFTGIRIGLSVAKGLANALNIKIIPFDTLTLIAYNTANADFVAFKGVGDDLYVADMISPTETKNMRLTKIQDFENALNSDDVVSSCDDLALSSCRLYKIDDVKIGYLPMSFLDKAKDSGEIEPIYLRLPQAEMQKRCNYDRKGN